jgi:hypothetical protein
MNPDLKYKDLSDTIKIWSNVDHMKHYYDAISELEPIATKIMNKHSTGKIVHDNRFKNSPSPPFDRSIDGIYLIASWHTKDIYNSKSTPNDLFNHDRFYRVEEIATPFGRVSLSGNGGGDKLKKVSVDFINKLPKICTLKDVTSEVKVYSSFSTFANPNYEIGPFPYYQETYKDSGSFQKVFQLQFNESFSFSNIVNTFNPNIYEAVHLSTKDELLLDQTLEQLSGKRRHSENIFRSSKL